MQKRNGALALMYVAEGTGIWVQYLKDRSGKITRESHMCADIIQYTARTQEVLNQKASELILYFTDQEAEDQFRVWARTQIYGQISLCNAELECKE